MINVQTVTWDNYADIAGLKVHETQEGYIASNTWSLIQAFVNYNDDGYLPITFGIYNDETLVGFTMFNYDDDNEYKDDDEPYYYIWRFMIAAEHQGKGYGKAAMETVLEHIKTMPHGEAKSVYLSYEPVNEVARKLYASFGFVETGEISEGEAVAKLSLEF